MSAAEATEVSSKPLTNHVRFMGNAVRLSHLHMLPSNQRTFATMSDFDLVEPRTPFAHPCATPAMLLRRREHANMPTVGTKYTGRKRKTSDSTELHVRPWDAVYALMPSTVMKKVRGVVQYDMRTDAPIHATVASIMLAGLAQVARRVHITAAGDVSSAESAHAAVTADQLVGALECARKRGDEALDCFCKQFRAAHQQTRPFALEPGSRFYYCSAVWSRNESGEASYSRAWADEELRHIPAALTPWDPGNVCRLLGPMAAGINTPYIYVGGTEHCFDVHLEECHQSAVNVRTQFYTRSGRTPCEPPALSAQPRKVPELHRQFWRDHSEGEAAVRRWTKKEAAKTLPLPFVAAANCLGYKLWYMFDGNTRGHKQLAKHARKALSMSRKHAPGISILQVRDDFGVAHRERSV